MAKSTKSKQDKQLPFEQTLWLTADVLRKNIDAAEYKHIVLGLIFLKYISDAFEEEYQKLKATAGADPEDKDEYLADNIFFVPKEARWSYLLSRAKLPSIGVDIDNAMDEVEKINPSPELTPAPTLKDPVFASRTPTLRSTLPSSPDGSGVMVTSSK